MDGSLGAALDSTAEQAVEFAVLIQALSSQAAWGALAITAMLLVIALLAELCHASEAADALPRAGVGQPALAVAAVGSASSSGPRERPDEPFYPFAESGLSPIDLVALTALRDRLRQRVGSGPTETDRQSFARWLACHGRLQG